MAHRSPTEFHDRWPDVAAYAQLPNVLGSPTQKPTLEVGDRAWDLGTSQYWYCVVPTLGGAVWVPGGGGGATQDHQTARIIVGNQLAGDTLFVCDFLDPGDGTGIDAAIASANVLAAGGVPVDVRIRPGQYTMAPALSAAGFVVKFDMRIVGAGRGKTVIYGGVVAPMTAPIFDARTAGSFELSDLTIIVGGSVGTGAMGAVMHRDMAKFYRLAMQIVPFNPVDYGGGFGMTATGYPDGVDYDTIDVFGVTSDLNYAAIRIDSGGQRGAPQIPLRIARLSVTGTPGLNFFAGIYLTDVSEAFLEDISVIDMPHGVRLSYVAPFGSYTRGPQLRGLYHRVNGSAYGLFAVRLTMNAAAPVTLIGTSFSDVQMEAGGATPANNNYLLSAEIIGGTNTLDAMTMQNCTARGQGGPEGPNVYIVAGSVGSRVVRPRLVNVAIDNELQVQGAVGATVDSPLLMGTEELNLFINGPTVINTQGVANRVRGVYTDTGTGTTVSIDIIGP